MSDPNGPSAPSGANHGRLGPAGRLVSRCRLYRLSGFQELELDPGGLLGRHGRHPCARKNSRRWISWIEAALSSERYARGQIINLASENGEQTRRRLSDWPFAGA